MTVWCQPNSNTELKGDNVIVCDENLSYLYNTKPVCVEKGKPCLLWMYFLLIQMLCYCAVIGPFRAIQR